MFKHVETKIFFIILFFGLIFSQPVSAIDLKMPFVKGESWGISVGYGGYYTHANKDIFAIDFSLSGETDFGKSVLAVADGVVEVSKWENPNNIKQGYGQYILIKHSDGFYSRYAHFNERTVEVGDEVKQGQLIGYLDSTGNSSGSHLHFAMYQKDDSGNLIAYKPEPMSGYTDFTAGEWYTSDNELYDPNKKVEEPTEQPQTKTLWQRIKEILGFFDVTNTSSKNNDNANLGGQNQNEEVVAPNKTAEEEVYSISFLNSGEKIDVYPGEEIDLVVEVKNTGNVVWNQRNISANVVGGLSANAIYYNQSWLTSLRPTLLDQSQVSPGGTGSFSFIINTPFTPGKYTFRIQTVRVDNNFNALNGGYWSVVLNVKEKEMMTDEDAQEAAQKLNEKIENLSEKMKEENEDDDFDFVEEIINNILWFEPNGTHDDEDEEIVTSTEENFSPEIWLNYPSMLVFYTTSTNIIFTGSYNTSTSYILVNNTSLDNLIMENGVWQLTADLDIGTSTFSFVGWNDDFSSSSSPVGIEVVREGASTTTLLAPLILQPSTSTFYTSSTIFNISGEKSENVKNIYLQQGDVITTSTILTTTTWEQGIILQEGENVLVFYGTDESGNQSPTTSITIILDSQSPEVEWSNIDLGSNWAQLDYFATDTTGVVGYDIQFLFQFWSWPPSDFDPTLEENEIILLMSDPLLWENEDDLFDYLNTAENERTWFTTSTASTSTFLQLADFIYELPVHFRIRAIDSLGNTSPWEYSGLYWFDSNYEKTGRVVISEIAWMGTRASSDDEWLEIMNVDDHTIDIRDWKLGWSFDTSTEEYGVLVGFEDTILDSGDSLLLERTSQDTVSTLDWEFQIYTGALSNDGEHLVLLDANGDVVDEVDNSSGWWFGDNETKESMYRSDLYSSGNDINSWCNFTSSTQYIDLWYKIEEDAAGNYILGSPGNAPIPMM